jgi:S-adenosylmethionine/arginine decarboxylase-like enzyme
MSDLIEQFDTLGAWGISANVDLYNCNPEAIRDASEIERYAIELCDLIQVTRFGDCVVVNFGEDERIAGFSMTQLIETSLISGHFANQTNNAYLDVFSCRFFDPAVVADFSKQFFDAESYRLQHSFRI